MKFFNRKRFAKPLLALVVGLVALVGLQGCFRSYSHGGHSSERMEKRMDHVQEGISDFLEIRPEQKEGFDALMSEYRTFANRYVAGWRDTKGKMNETLQADTLDPAALGENLKAFLREKPGDSELEGLIDRTLAFYGTLDAEQQQKVHERLAKHARRHS